MLIYTLPIIAALTGWITNYIAVKMLFHPRQKVKILFFEIQGIFPKRQDKLAERLGDVVARELFSMKDVKSALLNDKVSGEVSRLLEEKVDDFLQNRLVQAMPALAMFLNNDIKMRIKNILMGEFQSALPSIFEKFTDKIDNAVDVKAIVYQRVANFSSDKLEEILYSIMQKEFRSIEIIGGVLGFVIGLIQIGILAFQD